MEHGLSGAEAKKQARALATARERSLRERDRRRLAQLRAPIREAQGRRRLALRKAVLICRAARLRVREQIRNLRYAERLRINERVSALRSAERGTCRARKARIRSVGGALAMKRKALLLEEKRAQRQLRRVSAVVAKETRATARERRQESDEIVRGNLPPELRTLWDRFKRDFFKPAGRATRTEVFLEWAQANPDEVLRLQADQADLDVARLVREKTRLEKKLAKTKPYATSREDLETLKAMGLAPTQAAARRHASKLKSAIPF